jgi:hypothetical protein
VATPSNVFSPISSSRSHDDFALALTTNGCWWVAEMNAAWAFISGLRGGTEK